MTLHERFNTIENEARDRIHRVLATSNEKLTKLDEALAKVKKDDWSMPRVRREIEELRASALKRAGELPGEAVSRLASGTRTPIRNLAKGLADMAKRFEPSAKPEPAKPEPAKGNGGTP